MKAEYIEFEVYGWDIKIRFYPKSHVYKLAIDNAIIPSVSKLAKFKYEDRWLMRWSAKVASDFLRKKYNEKIYLEGSDFFDAMEYYDTLSKEACDIGKRIHAKIHKYIMIGTLDPILDCFIDWKEKWKIKFLETEKFVYSKEYNYCWQLDVIFERKWKKYIWDFKTSWDIYTSNILQTILYAIAYDEEDGHEPVDGIAIIRIDKQTWEIEEFIIENSDIEYQSYQEVARQLPYIHGVYKELEKRIQKRLP